MSQFTKSSTPLVYYKDIHAHQYGNTIIECAKNKYKTTKEKIEIKRESEIAVCYFKQAFVWRIKTLLNVLVRENVQTWKRVHILQIPQFATKPNLNIFIQTDFRGLE